MGDVNDVIFIPGSEGGDEPTAAVKLEKLNTLLDSTMVALMGGALAGPDSDDRKECLGRARRLESELGQVIRDLGDVREKHTVRVKNLDGIDELHEVLFPIYARGGDDTFRRVDADMLEVSIMVGPTAYDCGISRSRVNFLGGEGVEYWLGCGCYESSQRAFNNAMEKVKVRILPLI